MTFILACQNIAVNIYEFLISEYKKKKNLRFSYKKSSGQDDIGPGGAQTTVSQCFTVLGVGFLAHP